MCWPAGGTDGCVCKSVCFMFVCVCVCALAGGREGWMSVYECELCVCAGRRMGGLCVYEW